MKKPRIHQDDAPGGLTHNPFKALRPAAGEPSPAGPGAGPSASPVPLQESAGPADPAGPRRIVVQREKKGRGGKTVTRVSGPGLPAGEIATLARELKRALGCGASIEEGDILLQGALTERAAVWLGDRLGIDVTIGN